MLAAALSPDQICIEFKLQSRRRGRSVEGLEIIRPVHWGDSPNVSPFDSVTVAHAGGAGRGMTGDPLIKVTDSSTARTRSAAALSNEAPRVREIAIVAGHWIDPWCVPTSVRLYLC